MKRISLAFMICLILTQLNSCSGESGPLAEIDEEELSRRRGLMVERQLEARDIVSSPLLHAMRTIPRHRYVTPEGVDNAYEDRPLAIGMQQTISQPYIVAFMTQLLDPKKDQKILEIGSGSSYQSAVLAELAGEVYTIEIIPELAQMAARNLQADGYENVHVRAGDGYKGWPEVAPFDGIIVTAAPDHVPQPLKDQLKVGGRLVLPVGDEDQTLTIITRTEQGFVEETVLPVRFVPMTGEAQEKSAE